MLCMALADRLKQPLHEVMSWPIDTIYLWAAYAEIVEERGKDK